MSKYPYIGDNGNGTIVIFNKEARGFLIRPSAYSRREKGYYYSWNEDLFKNITREYLANTYGKVESREHAEFIIKLAAEHGLKYVDEWREGRFFCICNDMEKGMILRFFRETLAKSYGEKLITIPLPPTDTTTNTPEKDFEMTQIAKNNGDNLLFAGESQSNLEEMVYDENKKNAAIKTLENLGYTYHGAELWKPPVDLWQEKCSGAPVRYKKVGYVEKSKEWPAVGDEVLTKENRKATIIATHERFAWIENFEGYLVEVVNIDELKKPPTPEEELRDEIIKVIHDDVYGGMYGKESFAVFADALMSKFEITKKPQ